MRRVGSILLHRARLPCGVGAFLAGAMAVSCKATPAGTRTEEPRPSASAAEPPPSAVAPLPAHVTFRSRFSLGAVKLAVEDVRMSFRFDELLARSRARLVVNGGFFGGEGEPIGLAVSEGKKLSAFSPSLSGGVLWTKDGVAHLTATEDYRPAPVDFAIQCRPRLVVGSRANVKSDDGKRAARTAICLRKAGTEIEFDLAADDAREGPTLYELAKELAEDGCEEALNLDGGPSTGWAADQGGQRVFRSPRGPVRHAVVVF